MHGLIEVVSGDENAGRLALAGRFRLDESKAARVGRDAADDEIHPVGQTETVPANLDESARGHERPQPALERRAFLARDAKDLQQFLDGGGVIDPVADEPEHFLF